MLMEVKGLQAGYSKKVVVHGISMAIDATEIVALIGNNGAGKTTTLKTIFGLLKPLGGEVVYNGRTVTARSPMANVKDGINFIPQERPIFPDLSVMDNLDLGAYTLKGDKKSRLEMVYRLFPILKERSWQRAGTLSGGEQRMLGMGMALVIRPRLLLLDEPSLGLAPVLVRSLMEALQQIQKELGTSILLVEQNVKQALQVARRVYVMKMGKLILEESAEKLLQRGQWWDLF